MIKKAKKTARGLVGFGMTTGMGTAVIGKLGAGATGTYLQGQLGSSGISGYAPVMTSATMGMGMMNAIKQKKKRRKN